MFQTNLSNHEQLLLEEYKLAGIAGHTVDKGESRELFIRDFLNEHLPSNVEIGHGEVIGKEKRPSAPNNQIDVVVYDRSYPRIDMGGVTAYLIEGVRATIEVKSVLNYDAIKQAVRAAHNLKSLQTARDSRSNYMHCSIIGYTSDSEKLETIIDRISRAEKSLGITVADHRLGISKGEGFKGYDSPSIDCVVVLGLGVIHAYNSRCGLNPGPDVKNYRWLYSYTQNSNLQLWFLQLFAACNAMCDFRYLDYVRDASIYHPIRVRR